jgi:hypothetical protein
MSRKFEMLARYSTPPLPQKKTSEAILNEPIYTMNQSEGQKYDQLDRSC